MRYRILTILFLLVSASVYSQNIDIRILRSVYTAHDLQSDKLMKFVSNSNQVMIIGVPAAIGIAGLIKHDDKWINSACQLVVANVINLGASYSLKHAINRQRPFLTYPDIRNKVNEASPSFPSGHTSSAFATATTLSLSFPKWYIIVPSYIWAETVGYSRMQLGVHYPGDVLGGMILGAGSAYITFKLNKCLNKSRKRKHG